MFQEMFPSVKASYETYRMVCNTKFNISFGFPHSDSCSTCDKFRAEVNRLKREGNLENEIKLEIENELHKRKAQRFYAEKKKAKYKARTTENFVAIDFQKNIYLPNVPTNDIYYLR